MLSPHSPNRVFALMVVLGLGWFSLYNDLVMHWALHGRGTPYQPSVHVMLSLGVAALVARRS